MFLCKSNTTQLLIQFMAATNWLIFLLHLSSHLMETSKVNILDFTVNITQQKRFTLLNKQGILWQVLHCYVNGFDSCKECPGDMRNTLVI